MFGAALFTVSLIALAFQVQAIWPGSLVAVSLYKAHLMALGGWGGYWIDRALFPYDRPHEYLEGDSEALDGTVAISHTALAQFGLSMQRRAVVVAACLICVGLGA
jgi:hypothetical protein